MGILPDSRNVECLGCSNQLLDIIITLNGSTDWEIGNLIVHWYAVDSIWKYRTHFKFIVTWNINSKLLKGLANGGLEALIKYVLMYNLYQIFSGIFLPVWRNIFCWSLAYCIQSILRTTGEMETISKRLNFRAVDQLMKLLNELFWIF